jgi:hypothetical protein
LSEESIVEALDEFCNALENAVAVLRQALKSQTKSERSCSWDPSKIKWTQETGFKGPYERYPAKDQKAESTEDYKNMLADLKAHGGKLTRNGLFYWVFEDQATVGRKKRC